MGVSARLDGVDGRLGVAVSGGSDSLALLHLCVEQLGAKRVLAVTVDHGLRPEAAEEAAQVARICQALGGKHEVLEWRGWTGQGNLMDHARRARYDLMSDWARRSGVMQVALGHTADDVAETFLMRLARRSGLDGLSAMATHRQAGEIAWLRPVLHLRRAALRSYLTSIGVTWVDDPTNDDPNYERVRMRAVMRQLEEFGLSADAIAEAASNLSDAQSVVLQSVYEFACAHCTIEAGDVVIGAQALRSTLPELRRRILVHCLKWVSGGRYSPRRTTMDEVSAQIVSGQNVTASGCHILVSDGTIRVTRELAAVETQKSDVGEQWDGRWTVSSETSYAPDLFVGALGEMGLKACDDWRSSGLPRVSLLASPAVWRGSQLIAAPLAGFGAEWRAELSRGVDEFYSSILSR